MSETAYFGKIIISNPIIGLPGKVPWIPIEDGNGVASVDDPDLIAALRDRCGRRIGGVREITREEFDKKKVIPLLPRKLATQGPDRGKIRLSEDNPLKFPSGKPAAEAAGKSPEPSKPPEASPGSVESSVPLTGRIITENPDSTAEP